MSVWKRLQRVGKKAAKFQLTASFHSLTVDCSKSYQPHKLLVAWTRRGRRHTTQPQDWKSSLPNHRQCVVDWEIPENLEITSILYRDPKKSEYEDKEWTFCVEDQMKNSRRKPIASRSINLKEFVNSMPGKPRQTQLTIKLKSLSKKVSSVVLNLTLHTVLLKEKNSDDESMISITSLMSLNKTDEAAAATDVANLEDFDEPSGSKTQSSANKDEFAELVRKLSALDGIEDFVDRDDSIGTSLGSSGDHKELEVKTEEKTRSLRAQISPTPQKPSKFATLDAGKSFPSPVEPSNTSKDLLGWAREVTQGYKGVFITNMTTSFRNGLAFCAIIHHFKPDLIDFHALKSYDIKENNRKAFDAAASLGIPRVMDPTEMQLKTIPDQLLIMTYVHQLRAHFTKQEYQVNHLGMSSSESNYTVGEAPLPSSEDDPPDEQARVSEEVTTGIPKSKTDSNLTSKTQLRKTSVSPVPTAKEIQANRYRELQARAQKLLLESRKEKSPVAKKPQASRGLLKFNPDGTVKEEIKTKEVRMSQFKFEAAPDLNGGDKTRKSLSPESDFTPGSSFDSLEVLSNVQRFIDTGEYVTYELAALEREQEEIDRQAQEMELQLRSALTGGNDATEEERLLTQWFQLVSKKNALIRRNMQLNMLAEEDDLERRYQLLEAELRHLMAVDHKTEEHAQREDRLLRELVTVVNKRDAIVLAMDQHEHEIERDLEIERQALENVHGRGKDRSCSLQ